MKKIIFFILLLLFFLSGCDKYSDKKVIQPIEINEATLQSKAKLYVSNNIERFDSVDFRNQQGLCGEVNIKNKSGISSGFQKFIVINKETIVLEVSSNMDKNDFIKLWNYICE